jgi:hypothetical protein
VAHLLRRDVPETVIAGREVFFGLDVITANEEPLRIELAAQPEGAELDARTMTVRWRVPASAAGSEQRFVVRARMRDAAGAEHTQELPLAIRVVDRAPVPGQASVVPPFVGTLVTITSPDYLARTAREWPIERVLEFARDAAVDALPAEQQGAIERRSGAELFRDLLAQYAALHNNPRLDPASPAFDRRFESAHWRLVAVRPRVNKAIEELRLAYQAVDVPEPVFAMFRVRLFRGANAPSAEVAQANNVAFTRLVHQAFFEGARPRRGLAEGQARAVSAAVATLVRSVLTFRDPQNPLLRAGLVAIPEEARMGGGSTFDAQGNYVTGNAWAFTVANVKVDDAPAAGASRRAVRVVNVPISSFTFDIGPNPAGDAFTSVCPPRYRSGGEGSEPALAALCMPDGTVRVRERSAQGTWVAARRDALSEHAAVTAGEMLERVALRDPRRRNFEESGMTCVQCHVRDFDDGVLSEVQVRDPRVREPITPAREVARVAMQILPLGAMSRSPWLVQQETFQVCDLGRRIRAQLNVQVDLPCPEGY